MATSIDTIIGYKSIDFSPFEIRGVKSGVNNARTTGPVYVSGSYIPSNNTVTGDASFSHDSSLVTAFSFDSYPTLDTSALRVGDALEINNSSYIIQSFKNSTAFYLDRDVGSTDGTYAVSLTLTSRDYVIEPDTETNTLYGRATFTKGSTVVNGIGTSWGYPTDLIQDDFIKSSNYQTYYKITSVTGLNQVIIASPFSGDTITTDYTGKKWIIGNTDIRYSSDNVTYDNQKAKWKYDNLSGTDIPTSTSYAPFADGMDLRFTHSLTATAPDIMDVATVNEKTFSKKTIYDTFQYSLPVVPYPETLTLKINGIVKDQYPSGNQDYVLTYSQNPMYEPPPPFSERQVANIMFLKGIKDIQLNTSLTSSGEFYLQDSTGNNVSGLMPGSEKILINNISQTAYKDYILDSNTGLLNIVDSNINEQVVKYVAVNYNSIIDYGLSIYLNSVKQKISFPLNPTDDVIFQPDVGRLKPQGQDHPGPNDVYEVHYSASATDQITEVFSGYPGQSVFKTKVYPIQQGSMLLKSDTSSYLSDGEDFMMGYLTGSIVLSSALTKGDTFTAIYTPLSKQVNELTYSDNSAFCTVRDSRLIVRDSTGMGFTFQNKGINYPDTDLELLRVYNETKEAEYDITEYDVIKNDLTLPLNSVNKAIGLGATDVVVADYKLTQDTVEYIPAQLIHMNLVEGGHFIYFEGLNLSTSVFVDSVIFLSLPDAADQYIYKIISVVFDGVGTKILLSGNFTADLTDPNIYISDAPVSFITYNALSEPLISGSNVWDFNNIDLRNIFRPNTVLNISGDYYQVYVSSYNAGNTSVTLTSSATKDYINVSTFSYSDTPVYLEGQTEVYPKERITSLSQQPSFIMNYNNGTIKVSSDSSKLTVNGVDFLYSTYSTLGSLSSALNSTIPSLSAITYVPTWKSDKMVQVTDVPVFAGSNTVFYADNALRYGSTDTTNFFSGGVGSLTLTNPLKKLDRYYLDYLGLRFLNTDQVKYSAQYFTTLPAGSKVVASFQYDNLDQFYVEVLGQKDFLETVTKPRMTEEANQLNGNVGQGGDVAGDSDTGPSAGGIYGDEYRRQDAEIECRIFKTVYDFFQDRLNAYKQELESGFGYRLFNTDSTFSEEQQLAGTLSINRIFPMGYTGTAPRTINPLTGYYFDTGAVFVHGSSIVKNYRAESSWLSQLSSGGFIARADSNKYYKIQSIDSNNQLTLDQTFQEASTRKRPDRFQVCSGGLPLYDDDGYLGPKLLSASVNQMTDWGLADGDKFICNIDGSDATYTFEDPISKFFPLPSYVVYAIQPPPSQLNTGQIIEQLNTIPGLSASYGTILDSDEPYGYSSTIILKTDGTYNRLSLSSDPSAQAVAKLGFIPGSVALGNWDRTDSDPEIVLATTEKDLRWNDWNILNLMQYEQSKLDRITNELGPEIAVINDELATISKEMQKLQTEISATGTLIEETSISTYNDSSTAHLNATDALIAAIDASAYDRTTLALTWTWPIDFQQRTADIVGLDGLASLTLTAPSADDLRVLNTTIYSVGPRVVFQDNDGSYVNGTWTGWDSNPPIDSNYSITNEVTFTIAPTPVLSIAQSAGVTNAYYRIDNTALNLYWDSSLISHSRTYNYDSYPTIGVIRDYIKGTTDFDATCDPLYYTWNSRSLQVSTDTINPDATFYYGLRDARVSYQSISDRLLLERVATVSGRFNYLLYNRLEYLTLRESQIKNDIMGEGLLRTSSGSPGDVYAWANNRFNRRQGCYARLNQIESQIASNQSALNINKGFM